MPTNDRRVSRQHIPIMLAEVLEYLRPAPGEIAVDATLGGGGHARALLERIQPGGRLIGLDTDADILSPTVAGFRESGVTAKVFTAHHANFTALPAVLEAEGVGRADVILVDLGVSAMQLDSAERGFSYKVPGPLDMRLNRAEGATAWQLVAGASEPALAALLAENADEPHAALIAHLLKAAPAATTPTVERRVRTGLTAAMPGLTKPEVKLSVRRTFQALRIAVNDEYRALETLLAALPACLAPGGRVAVLTFHSGEDRRVKRAFREGLRQGAYSAIAREVVRSSKDETYRNRRAQAAKLRWAVRAP